MREQLGKLRIWPNLTSSCFRAGQIATCSGCRYRRLRAPATTFVITHSPSRSNRRDGFGFLGKSEPGGSTIRMDFRRKRAFCRARSIDGSRPPTATLTSNDHPHSNVRIVDASGSVAWPNASPIPPSNSKAIVKEFFVGFVGWLWIAAVLCTIYLLASAILFSGSWWLFFACAVAAWLLYRVALYFQLEKERVI